jgi:hypothetical protein
MNPNIYENMKFWLFFCFFFIIFGLFVQMWKIKWNCRECTCTMKCICPKIINWPVIDTLHCHWICITCRTDYIVCSDSQLNGAAKNVSMGWMKSIQLKMYKLGGISEVLSYIYGMWAYIGLYLPCVVLWAFNILVFIHHP